MLCNGDTKMTKRTATPNEREQLWLKAKKKCEACGKTTNSPSEGQAGHKFAHSSGGSTKLHNMVYLCYDCNRLQKTMKYETFLKKYSKSHPGKYKKSYIKYMKEKKQVEVDEIKKQVQKINIELHKTKSEAKIKTLKNKLEKFKREQSIIDDKYKLDLGSKGKTPMKNIFTKPISRNYRKKKTSDVEKIKEIFDVVSEKTLC